MNSIATPSSGMRGRQTRTPLGTAARAGYFGRRADAIIMTASVFLLAFTTLGSLGMPLTGVLLHQIGMPGYVIWPAVAGVGILTLAGVIHIARLVWRYETGCLDQDDRPGTDSEPKAARKTSRAA